MKSPWNELEHRIYKQFLEENLKAKKLLLLVSGGMDSMAMLMLMHRICQALQLELLVLHCHHGDSLSPSQGEFRNRAQLLVNEVCQQLGLRFYFEKAFETLSSEEQFREFRKQSAKKIMLQNGCDYTLWAHHENDLIETQMLRLIRGAGSEAAANPMLFMRNQEIRPFIAVSKREICDYCKELKIEFLDDPSNDSDVYLRNWMRNKWLPMLEEKQPGALRSLSRSLVLLHDSNEIDLPAEIWVNSEGNKAISRRIYGQLSTSQRRFAIVQAIKLRGILNFSYNHVLEVMKHLDKAEKEHTFKVASLAWTVSSDLILFSANV